MNPADVPSRGCSAKHLLESRCREGPEWLKRPREQWPSTDYTVDEEEVSKEIKKSSLKTKKPESSVQYDLAMSNTVLPSQEQEDYWYLKGPSKYSKILRMMAWILRFIAECRKIRGHQSRELTAKEVVDAELKVLSLSQEESFNSINDPRIKCLNPFTDKSGVLRLKTLVSSRNDQFGFRYPIVLDPRHPLTTKLIQYRHEKHHDAGVQIVMSNLREQVWIISSRRAIRSVIAKSAICKRYKATRIEAPIAALPEERVRDAAAFKVSGVDFAAPLYLRGGEKAWICLFTCAVYKAIHLELVTSLSTEAFMGALRRFIARRGRPSIVFSDDGTNFIGANNLLRGIDWKKIAEYSSVEKIDWRFNPPSAAWWGGWWECLVRIIKELLRKILGRACLTFEDLCTTLCDCEAIVNSRPITYISEDPNQLVPLTPAMFLQDRLEVGVPDLDNIDGNHLSKRRRNRQKLQEDLRRRFRSEYLGQLSRPRSTTKGITTVREGDVVFVGHDNQKRLDWPLARIIEVIPGRDGEVRVARIRTATGELVRPVQLLYPLEMSAPVKATSWNKTAAEINDLMPETLTIEESHDQTQAEQDLETPIKTESSTKTKSSTKEISKIENIRTRCGRRVNMPKKLNL